MSATGAFIITGQIVHADSPTSLEYISDGVIVVNDGVIVAVERSSANIPALQDKYNVKDEDVQKLTPYQLVIPGLVDTHIHAPQYPNAGLGLDLPLLDWLNKYTFPLESRYYDLQFAAKVYQNVIKKTLAVGTTTASYFATIHTDAALLLANSAIKQNQRAFVGKVNMNVGNTPGLVETLEETIQQTKQFIANFPKSSLVKPVVTPRFALSCDMEAMKQLAQIAVENNLHIQTHISENKEEIEAVHATFPQCSSYADVYDQSNLLTSKTVLAHAVHLSDDEISLIRARGAAISHCPNSNISLQSGACPVRHLLNNKLKVGLGTDCAGGYSISMLDSIRHALETSILVANQQPELPRLTLPEIFYMATQGGANALAIGDMTGNFEVNKMFDALLVDLTANESLQLLDNYNLEQLVQKLIYLGDDRNIVKVYVNGQISVDKTKAK